MSCANGFVIELARPRPRAWKRLHDQVLADIGFGDDELVDVEAVVVLGVGDRRHHALAHVLRDALPRELRGRPAPCRPSCRGSDRRQGSASAARRAGSRHGLRLAVGEAALAFGLAHITSPSPYLPLVAFLSPLWPWNMRVGANSPNLWPIMSSVTSTGMCFWPLCTPNVRPTNCGRIVERRLQILMISLRPDDAHLLRLLEEVAVDERTFPN